MSGKMTRVTGEVMTDYANNHTGIIATGAGLGGKINTAVGGAVEDIGKKGENGSGSKSEQFIDANRQVVTAAVNSLKDDKAVNVRAQKRLQTLGYDVGTADGMIGPKTRAALGSYQEKNGLQITQTLDDSTLAALKIRH